MGIGSFNWLLKLERRSVLGVLLGIIIVEGLLLVSPRFTGNVIGGGLGTSTWVGFGFIVLGSIGGYLVLKYY